MHDDLTILVVDDFSTMRRIIKKILSGLGITQIIEAENAHRAWEILSGTTVNLIICDWNMPGMTGMDLLKKVRSHETYHCLPFIMVTAEGKDKAILEEEREGFTAYIGKPFKAEDLERQLKAFFLIFNPGQAQAVSDNDSGS